MKPGQVIGKTDKISFDPEPELFSPMDLAATIYLAIGVDYGAEVLI